MITIYIIFFNSKNTIYIFYLYEKIVIAYDTRLQMYFTHTLTQSYTVRKILYG